MVNPHGGDLIWAKTKYSGEILDFSVNCNPLGTPPSVLAAAADALSRVGQYPDPACSALRAAIAQRLGCDEAEIFCGNGAAEVIFRLALAIAPGEALLTAPTFSEYESALTQVGCHCRFHRLLPEEDFDLTARILGDITPDLQAVFLCTPNNPTGRLISRELLCAVLQRCEEVGAYLIVDECFLPLATGEIGLAPLVKDHPKLVVLRAFTKSYAVPSLRLGYCVADPGLVEKLHRWGGCWNVSGVAQAAGLACLQEPDWPAQGRKRLETARPALLSGLAALGCTVVPGSANYLLFRLPGVTDLKERAAERGILLRSCGNYRGLGQDYYRVAVRCPEENETLLRVLASCISKEG